MRAYHWTLAWVRWIQSTSCPGSGESSPHPVLGQMNPVHILPWARWIQSTSCPGSGESSPHPVLGQVNPVHILSWAKWTQSTSYLGPDESSPLLISCFFMIHFNIVFPSVHRSIMWSLSYKTIIRVQITTSIYKKRTASILHIHVILTSWWQTLSSVSQ
jgi:hypothetical protein